MTKQCLTFIAMMVLARLAWAENIVFPPDTGVIDVTQPPYNADKTGQLDASEVIRLAISNNIGSRCFIYFPNGTYKVSKPLWWKGKGWKGNEAGWWARLVFRGQSRAGVVIQLADSTPEFGDPAKPLGVIVTASESPFKDGGNNQGFNNTIRNLTINTGRGNPGAVGIDYLVSNQGAIKDVTILSGDGQGYAGIRMERAWPGPGLIKNVEIQGFNFGIKWDPMDYSMTLEHITLKNQKIAGIYNKTAQAHICDLTSINTVPALVSPSGFNMLVGANLSGGSSTNAAIISNDTLVRDATISGYGTAIDDRSKANHDLPMSGNPTRVTEYVNPPARSLFPSPPHTLRLPVEETPEYADEDPSQWANIMDYGALRDGKTDCTAAIQKALNSGKATIWLPGKASYRVTTTLTIPAQVRHITGPHSAIVGKGGFFKDKAHPQPVLKVAENSGQPLILEHIDIGGDQGAIPIEHASTRTVVAKHGGLHGGQGGPGDSEPPCYTNSVTGGKLFIEDMMGSRYKLTGPQQMWARQLNTEYGTTAMLDVSGAGAKAWIMGWKTENSAKQPVLRVAHGAEVESFGPFNYMLNSSSDTPLITNDEGRLSICYRQAGQHGYKLAIRETRDGVVREAREQWGNVVLYVGYKDKPSGSGPAPNPKPQASINPADK